MKRLKYLAFFAMVIALTIARQYGGATAEFWEQPPRGCSVDGCQPDCECDETDKCIPIPESHLR